MSLDFAQVQRLVREITAEKDREGADQESFGRVYGRAIEELSAQVGGEDAAHAILAKGRLVQKAAREGDVAEYEARFKELQTSIPPVRTRPTARERQFIEAGGQTPADVGAGGPRLQEVSGPRHASEMAPAALEARLQGLRNLKKKGNLKEARDAYLSTARTLFDGSWSALDQALAGGKDDAPPFLSDEELGYSIGEHIRSGYEGVKQAYREIGYGGQRFENWIKDPDAAVIPPLSPDQVNASIEGQRAAAQAASPEVVRHTPISNMIGASLATLPLYTGVPGGGVLSRSITAGLARAAPRAMRGRALPSLAAPPMRVPRPGMTMPDQMVSNPAGYAHQYGLAGAEGALREDLDGGGVGGAAMNLFSQGASDLLGHGVGQALTRTPFDERRSGAEWGRKTRKARELGIRMPPGYEVGSSAQLGGDRALLRHVASRRALEDAVLNPNRNLANQTAADLAGIQFNPKHPRPTFNKSEVSEHVRDLDLAKDALLAGRGPTVDEPRFQQIDAVARAVTADNSAPLIQRLHRDLKRRVFQTRPGPPGPGGQSTEIQVFRGANPQWLQNHRKRIRQQIEAWKDPGMRAQGRRYLNAFDELYEDSIGPEALASLRDLRTQQYWSLNLLEEGVLDSKTGDVNPQKIFNKFYQKSSQAKLYDQRMVDRAEARSPGAFDTFEIISDIDNELVKTSSHMSDTRRLEGEMTLPEGERVREVSLLSTDPYEERTWRPPTLEDWKVFKANMYARGYPSVTGLAGGVIPARGIDPIRDVIRHAGRTSGQFNAQTRGALQQWLDENVGVPLPVRLGEALGVGARQFVDGILGP